MRVFDAELSKYSLQKWIALIAGTGALLISVLNYVTLVGILDAPVAEALVTPSVLAIIVLGLLCFATGLADSKVLRGVQIVAFLLGAAATAIGTTPGNLTSALFAIYGIVLVNEYAGARSRMIPSLLIGLGYIAVFILTAQLETVAPIPYIIAAIIFTSQLVLLFALVTYRQSLQKRMYAEQLESKVEERTAELRVALGERDTIIRELHHRIGNSLQLLGSYVSLQKDEVAGVASDVLSVTELRIQSIASVHAILYDSGQLTHASLRDYTLDRVSETASGFDEIASIEAEIDAEIVAHIDFLLPFGIVLTELVANAARHGRTTDQPKAFVSVTLTQAGENIDVIVEDDGPGFSAPFSPGIGSMFVDQLVEQLGGTLIRQTKPTGGSKVQMRFPIDAILRRKVDQVAQ